MTPAPSPLEDYPIVVEFPLHWGEMDALGHANNARFFTWFESARIALFQKVGVATDSAAGVGPILATTQCDFLAPVLFPALVQVGVRVSKLGTTSPPWSTWFVSRDRRSHMRGARPWSCSCTIRPRPRCRCRMK